MTRLTKPGPAVLALAAFLAGCALPSIRTGAAVRAASPNWTLRADVPATQPEPASSRAVSQVSYPEPGNAFAQPDRLPRSGALALVPPASEPSGSNQAAPMSPPDSLPTIYHSDDPSDPFNGLTELPLDRLVAEVEARNPSLQAASAAWRAAAERYPQAISLDDPMFTVMMTPTRGLGSMDGGGWMVQGTQLVPWPGKRALRGSIASSEANAMKGDIGDTRLRLAEAARVAFFDYYMAWRQMEVNTSTQKLVKQLREIAWNKYQVNQVTQQDVLQADVELADLATRSAELTRDQQVAQARINTLLHRAADYPLPPPPKDVSLPDGLPAVEDLQQTACRARPDLYAQYFRIQAEESNLALACKEYYPDLNLAARYDGFMPQDMRPQVGMDINIPIRYARRSAAVREASDRIAQRRAEYQNLLDQVRFEVQSSFTRVVQAAEVARLYRDKTLPASERSLQSAQANYTTGTLDFLRLLDAERQLNDQRERYYAAIAEYHQRLAELERAVGEPVGAGL